MEAIACRDGIELSLLRGVLNYNIDKDNPDFN
jgi:hypothetical protein